MRGVNLRLFDFDYDLTWHGFFLNHRGHVYGRYGGREDRNPDRHLTLPGLKYAMQRALEAQAAAPDAKPAELSPPSTPEQLPSLAKMKKSDCIHCHQVNDGRREDALAKKTWQRDDVWNYPSPDRLGLVVAGAQGNKLEKVPADSPAAKAGLAAGDVIESVGGRRTSSFADVQFALHETAREAKSLAVVFRSAGGEQRATLELGPKWRESDITWRTSMWGIPPQAHVYGDNLSVEEKKKLGLEPKRLAFRQGKFVPKPSAEAGIRAGDVIIGIDDQPLEMDMLEFNVHIRLNYKLGDRITFNVLRDGKRVDFPMTLTSRRAW